MGKPQDGTLPVSAPQRGPNSGRQTWRRRGGCLAVLALASTGWCIVSLPYLASSLCHPARHHGLELNDWIHRQEEISYDKILGNIGPAAGAKDGLVVASPSRGEPGQPDYFVRRWHVPGRCQLIPVRMDARLGLDIQYTFASVHTGQIYVSMGAWHANGGKRQ